MKEQNLSDTYSFATDLSSPPLGEAPHTEKPLARLPDRVMKIFVDPHSSLLAIHISKISDDGLGVVMYTCNPRVWKAEAGGLL